MKKDKLVYFAGIIDGEGTIRIELQKANRGLPDYYRLRLSVANTNLELMGWIRDNFGSKPLKEKHRKGNRKQCYQWDIKSPKRAIQIIRQIQPYLIAKKEQARVALALAEIMVGTGHRYKPEQRKDMMALYEEMKALNRRGILTEPV